MNPHLFLNTLKSLDLEYSAQTGGCMLEDPSEFELAQLPNEIFCIFAEEKNTIQFIYPGFFLKTLAKAEGKLALTLFR